MPQKIQLRRDTLANFVSNNVILSAGEPAYTTDINNYRIGDGVTAFADLPVAAKLSDLIAIQTQVNTIAANETANATSIVNLTNDVISAQNTANTAQEMIITLASDLNGTNGVVTDIDLRVIALENAPTLTAIDGGNALGN